ncbi:MAG: hypothetical protein MUE98_01455 [Rhodobacteraceae bacterium]|jgi:flagellar biosynthesis/type III secretory pathway protein FliH|nr:hypothetical protein [Paracoccaceae bacterium]
MRRIRLLEPDRFSGWDVIPAALLAECEQAQSVLREAEAWAEAKRATIGHEIETARAEAHAEAYAEGLRQFTEAVRESRAVVADLNDRLLDLLKTCLRQVLATIPADELLQSSIAPVLRVVPAGQPISIAVHPDRVADLEAALAGVARDMAGGFAAEALPDGTLDRDACLIFTQTDVFDVGIEVMTDRLIDAVATHLKAAQDTGARGAP